MREIIIKCDNCGKETSDVIAVEGKDYCYGCINNIEYNPYICFLLIGDKFYTRKLLLERANELGMDGLYDITKTISIMFNIYDKKNKNNTSEYESFEKFIYDYRNKITKIIKGEI